MQIVLGIFVMLVAIINLILFIASIVKDKEPITTCYFGMQFAISFVLSLFLFGFQ